MLVFVVGLLQGRTGFRRSSQSVFFGIPRPPLASDRSNVTTRHRFPVDEDRSWSEQDEQLYWGGLAGARPLELGQQDRKTRDTAAQPRAFPAAVMKDPFATFSAQCSHNTYLWGTQSAGMTERANSVDERAVYVALDLGYRCIEIDVWRRNNPKLQPREKRWDGPLIVNGTKPMVSYVKVAHQLWNGDVGATTGRLTNQVDLTLFVQQVLLWCENDEKRFPATASSPKLPIVISIENHGETPPAELYMRKIFEWFGDRIILPKSFPPGTSMSAVAATEGKRFIILKTRAEATLALAPIIAINEDATRRTYLSKSFKMDCKKPTSGHVQNIRTTLSEGKLVRTYPCNEAWKSENYSPGPAFDARAQMVCINFQGNCHSAEKICREPVRGQKRSKGCECERDIAASLEAAFKRWGYDGYIHYPSLGEAAWREFRHLQP
eukprot:TRINITY_DN8447_c0_g2_i2.p1 TRINITY_DN8447_c0_g2~~TRINITY_DN8447_c0_g2_i2.p1  ORF type:complete len:455 (+),score=21.51 TRINITY_DN8447_c0_g2_i2:58-1365(+)